MYGIEFKTYVKSRATERGDLLKEFMEAINISRKGTKFKKVGMGYVASKVGHIKKIEDLYYFASVCRDAGNRNRNGDYYNGFCKRFFWELRPKEQ